MESMRKSGKIVMLVNISHLFQRKFRAFAESAILDVYSDALKRLIQVRPETVILLVPHDKRGEFSDDIMAKQLFENIVSEYGKNVMIAPLLSAPEIKALAGCADVAFSGRMHLAIACLGQGIPVGCLEYQGKFEGLLKHFDLPELRIDSNKTFNSENLLNTICVLIDKRNMLKAKVESALPNIKELALANFKT
jgi:polysaccharide pyruvyl transferase WcaK-like protein